MSAKPFGWEVEVWTCEYMVKVEQNSKLIKKAYRSTRAQAVQRAMMAPHAYRIAEVRPVTEEEWRRVYGDPEQRGL